MTSNIIVLKLIFIVYSSLLYKLYILFDSNGVEAAQEGEVNGDADSGFSGGLIAELADLFEGELKPVAPKAQKKVPMPAE